MANNLKYKNGSTKNHISRIRKARAAEKTANITTTRVRVVLAAATMGSPDLRSTKRARVSES